MKKLIFFCFLVLPFITMGQDFSNNWEGFFSYFQIKDLDYGNGKLYAASENAIFTTQVGSQAQQKITTLDGLSGERISAINYSEDYQLLFIGYENGLLQIYDPNTKGTTTFIDIVQKQTIAPTEKRINDFYETGGQLFISTNYGISDFNIANKEFSDSYFIGDNGGKLGVNALTVFQDKIYAATKGGGLRYTPVNNPNIVDYNEWQQIGSGSIKSTVSFQGSLYTVSNTNSLQRLNGNTLTQVYQFNQNVQDIKASQQYLTTSLEDHVIVFDGQINFKADFATNQIDSDFTTALTYGTTIYIGDNNFGLLRTSLNNPVSLNFLSPNGPLRNDVFNMDLAPNELWLVYGDYGYYYNPYPLKKRGLSHFKNEQWTNIPYNELPQNRSIIDVSINPRKTEQAFFFSYHDGLLEVVDDEVENFYDVNNSNLEPTDNPNEQPDAVRIGPSVFDNSGNLWFANALSADGLIKFPAEGGANDFVQYDISDVIPDTQNNNGFGAIVMDNSGNIFLGSYKDGVVGFEASTKTFAKVKGGEGEGNLPSDYVSSLALDNNNQLWIGTTRGLRVLFGPSGMFDNANLSTNNIVFLDEDGVAQELFSGLSITDIVVDGNNNKWVGSTAGAYYVSSDGQKTFHHFTTDNSPLPSNTVSDIEIDGSSGKVYIGTEKGLVAFRGTATSSAENLDNVRAFPNPVRPRYQGMVTIDGLMENANVKITDIEGNLVYEKFSDGGSIQWDTRAFGKYKVASGVYMVMVTSDDQAETKVAKIMIIR